MHGRVVHFLGICVNLTLASRCLAFDCLHLLVSGVMMQFVMQGQNGVVAPQQQQLPPPPPPSWRPPPPQPAAPAASPTQAAAPQEASATIDRLQRCA